MHIAVQGVPPVVSSFTPTSAGSNGSVVITGSNLTGTTAVSFGGTAAASFAVNSDTQITAAVGAGTSGSVSVTTAAGTTSLANFTYLPAPAITSFAPSSGAVGSLVTITGTNSSSPTGVTVGGTAAIILSSTSTQVVAMVMPGAVTGTVSLTNANGTGSGSSNFTVTATSYPFAQQGPKLQPIGGSLEGNLVAISSDGNTVVVGPTPAVVYIRSNGAWVQQASLSSGASSIAISADGNTVLLGFPFNNTTGISGVFTRSNGVWTSSASLTVTGATGSTQQGTSVGLSADGNTAVVGGPADNSSVGAVWVFKRVGNTWTQQGTKLVGTGYSTAAKQGFVVSISADGNTIAEGGYTDNSVGAVWVFTQNANIWSQQGSKLVGTGYNGNPAQGYGLALSADGNTLVEGGYTDVSTVTGVVNGACWVFTRTGGTWVQQGSKLAPLSVSGGLGVSIAVSADGNTFAAGSPGDNLNTGAMFVFTRSNGSWTAHGGVAGTGQSSSRPRQGTAVAMTADGSLAISGGPGDTNSTTGSVGSAWIFGVTPPAPAIASVNPASGAVGTLVTITGTDLNYAKTATIGGVSAIILSNSNTQLVAMVMPGAVTGTVVITTAGGSNTGGPNFTVTATPYPSLQQGAKIQEPTGLQQGASVALSADGSTAVIGGVANGYAWAYTRSGAVWTLQSKLTGNDAVNSMPVLNSVAITPDGNTIAVGEQGDNTGVGAVWIYKRSNGVWTQQGNKIVCGGTSAGSYAGKSVALSAMGDVLVIGAPGFNNNVGATYVFKQISGTWAQISTNFVGTGYVSTAGSVLQGTSVAVSADGKIIAVGGSGDNGNIGAVWTFVQNGSSYSQQGNKLVGAGYVGMPKQGSGVALSADGSTLLVGGPSDQNASGSTGSLWAFTGAGGSWVQQGNSFSSIPAVAGAGLGTSVALSADGNTAVTGTPGYNSGAGGMFVYTRTGGIWTQRAVDTGTGEDIAAPHKGNAVSISADGSYGLLGDSGDGSNNNGRGATWVFNAASPAQTTTTQSATAITSAAATLNGTVNDNGSATTVTFLYGTAADLTGATSAAVTTGTSPIAAGTGTVSFTSNITNLTANTVYYFRINGVNANGASNGSILSFTTSRPTPTITSFSPAFAGPGSYVVLTGTNFTGAAAVSFGGAAAKSFTVTSDTQITAVVGTGATGNISVTTPGGTATLPGFSFITPPSVSYQSTSQTYTVGNTITPLAVGNSGGTMPAALYGKVSVLAGSGTTGSANGAGTAASFKSAFNMCTDAAGNIYVADQGNNTIRKITPAGVVTTLAGSGTAGSANGTGSAASFNFVIGVGVDSKGNVYAADGQNNLIRKITPAGVVTTFAGSGAYGSANGTGTAATFGFPSAIAVDASDNLFVTEGNDIRKITPAGVVTTVTSALSSPWGITLDAAGLIYVSDASNRAFKVTQAGVVTVLAGSGSVGSANGTGTAATFNNPNGVAVDALGNLYIADTSNELLRKITPAGVVTTLAGNGTSIPAAGIGTGAAAAANGVAIDLSNNLYFSQNFVIKKVNITGYAISPALPAGLAIDSTGTITGTPTAVSPAANYTVIAYNQAGSSTTTVNISVVAAPTITSFTPTSAAANAIVTITGTNFTGATAVSFGGTAAKSFVVNSATQITAIVGAGASGNVSVTTPASTAMLAGFSFQSPPAISYASSQTFTTGAAITPISAANSGGAVPAGNYGKPILFANTAHTLNNLAYTSGYIYATSATDRKIIQISPAGVATDVAGSGAQQNVTTAPGASAALGPVLGIAVGSGVFVVDNGTQTIRQMDTGTGNYVYNYAGAYSGTRNTTAADGSLSTAKFVTPLGITSDGAGSLYVSDFPNIRKISGSTVSTLQGSATPFTQAVKGLTYFKNTLYFTIGNQVQKFNLQNGLVTTLTGSASSGSTDGTAATATFSNPAGIAIDQSKNTYVADYGNGKIRKVDSTGTVSTLAVLSNPSDVAYDGTGNVYAVSGSGVYQIATTGYSVSPTLPAGLSIDGNGTIAGTPTTASPATTYTITAYNTSGSSSTTITIAVTATTLLGPLDKIGTGNTASAAYSLRQLKTTYTHSTITPPATVAGYTNSTTPVIRVRRSSDNALLDVGYTANGDLDTTALKNFAVAGNVFIATWYDQSGYNRDVIQTNLDQQPYIVTAGVVERSGTMPAIRFVGAKATVLQATIPASDMFGSGYMGTAFPVFEAAKANTTSSAFGYAGSLDRWQVHSCGGAFFDVGNPFTRVSTVDENAYTGIIKNYTMLAGNSLQQVYVNGTLKSSATTPLTACTQSLFTIGGIPDFSYYHTNHESELVFYGTALADADRQTVENNQSAYYSTKAIPEITAFSPQSGGPGTSVTITGQGFTGTTSVNFGGVPASSFTVNSDNSITAIVGAGAAGDVTVTNTKGSGTIGGGMYGSPLDKAGNSAQLASAAYSLRQLKTNYTHKAIIPPYAVAGNANSATPVVRVRRTSDGNQLDIGYTASGDLDTTALKTFVGTGDGYVTIWYDQSGHNRDVVQTSPNQQPFIVTAGIVERSGAMPAIRFVGASQTVLQATIQSTDMFGSGYMGTAFPVFEAAKANTTSSAFGYAGSLDRWQVHSCGGAFFDVGNPFTRVSVVDEATYTGIIKNYTMLAGTNLQQLYVNGTLKSSATTPLTACTQSLFTIGGVPDFSYYHTNHESELIFYGSALADADRQSVEGNQIAYYGTNSIPSITAFSPQQGGPGTSVTITGQNFSGATSVKFGGITASTFTVNSDNSITAIVGTGTAGDVTVTTPKGTAALGGGLYGTPLDKAAGSNAQLASAAYSLRQLKTTYTHKTITAPPAVAGSVNSTTPVIRVRRTSDGESLDIGYTASGDLDTTALKSFVGTGNGYVTTWYDQSGHSRDVVQTSPGQQPFIVTAGTIERSGAMPAVRFVGSSQTVLQTTVPAGDMFGSGYMGTVFPVYEAAKDNITSSAFGYSGSLDRWQVHSYGGALLDVGNPFTRVSVEDEATYTGVIKNYTMLAGTNKLQLYVNGTLKASSGTPLTACTQSLLNIGGVADFSYYHTNHESELIFYGSALTDADRQAVETSQHTYYFPQEQQAASQAQPTNMTVNLKQPQMMAYSSTVGLTFTSAGGDGTTSYQVQKLSATGAGYSSVTTMNGSGTGSYKANDSDPLNGDNFYRVLATDSKGKTAVSETVKLNIATGGKGIQVYPVPVMNKQIVFNFSKMEAGMYDVTIVSKTGYLIGKQTIRYDGYVGSVTIAAPANKPTEVYFITIASPAYKRTEKVIIE